jgi:hypothetical protein
LTNFGSVRFTSVSNSVPSGDAPNSMPCVWYLNYAHGEHSDRRPRSIDVPQS